jgi:hypothetical protein
MSVAADREVGGPCLRYAIYLGHYEKTLIDRDPRAARTKYRQPSRTARPRASRGFLQTLAGAEGKKVFDYMMNFIRDYDTKPC